MRIAVFGAGPRAVGHVETLTAVLADRRPVAEVTYLVRRPGAVAGRVMPSTGPEADDVVAAADVIVCATTARSPLFDSSLVRGDAVVVAVGSHQPDVREVDGALVACALVIVEDVATALREAGDVVMALGEGRLRAEDLVPMADVVAGVRRPEPGRPVLFKSAGMSGEDLVVASAVHEQDLRHRPRHPSTVDE